MPVNKDVQNDAPHSCRKPMHQIHAKHGTCSGYGQKGFSKLVFIQGDSIRLVSAAIIAPPLAVATLTVGSDSKVAPNTHFCLAKSGNVANVALMGSEVYSDKM